MMKKIELQKMSLLNFKGIRNLTIDFKEKNTDIFGANGTGKTSIFDAFTWLLFGKDSTDRKDFEIKTLDSHNRVIEKIDHEVEATLFINGDEVILKRMYREKWVKQRGAFEPTFSGNETLYYWNEVPMNQKEYTSKINDMLDESIFKLISNPLAFNALKWQDRRKVLMDIAAGSDDVALVKGDADLEALLQLQEKKTITELKAETSSKVKKIKADLELIPIRIDEVQKGKPVPIDYGRFQACLKTEQANLATIDKQLLDKSEAHKIELEKKTKLQEDKHRVERDLNELVNKFKTEANQECKTDDSALKSLEMKLKTATDNLLSYEKGKVSLEAKRESLSKEVTQLNTDANHLREQWHQVNASALTFGEDEFVCTCCNRPFETDDIEAKKEELLTNFNTDKAKKLQDINSKGGALKNQIEAKHSEIETIETRLTEGDRLISETKKEVETYTATLQLEQAKTKEVKDPDEVYLDKISKSKDFDAYQLEIKRISEELTKEIVIDNNALKEQRTTINAEIDRLKGILQEEVTIKAANERIERLQEEEKSLSLSLNELEKLQYTIERFIKLKIDALESDINKRFEYVTFKLFETQINGGETETCQTLINGVPFSDANTASKINAGLDIINILSEFYNVEAPIFIDNRESISELIETKSQIVNLYVSPQDTTLRILN